MVNGLNSIVITARKRMNNLNIYSENTKHISVTVNATKNTARKFLFITKMLIRVLGNQMTQNGFIQHDIGEAIQNEFPILKPKDMRGREMLKEVIFLQNGKTLKEHVNIAVLFVGNRENLPKTILFHCRKVAQIILRIFNLSAEIAIAKNGSAELCYFNIYENPDLIKER